MLLGETIAYGAQSTCTSTCTDCGVKLTNQVLKSGASYYIGTFCGCGPYSRESGYYRTEKEASEALASGVYERW